MNLTLKQLFKYGVVCLSACALSATALDTVSDSFEAGTPALGETLGSDGLPIGEYKMVVSGGQDEITNLFWYAAAGDASTIVSNDAAYADIVGDGPITNDTAELILNLETEGNTLSRTAGVSVATNPGYIDTLIQFTPSEDEPTIDTSDVKVALYVNAMSNLVVVHSMFVDPSTGDYTVIETNSVIAAIDPDAWYRLSMKVVTDAGETFTQIYLDGVLITHPNAFELDPGTSNGGSDFRSIEAGVPTINLISFQGTGLLDELVVSDEMPNFATPVAIMLTLVPADMNVSFSPVGPVESGTEVTITAVDWYRVDSVTGPINETVLGLPAVSVTTTLTAVASCSVTATVAVVDGTYPIGGGSYDAATVAAWAMANGLDETDVDGSVEDDYLLNVDPAEGDATIVITDIVITGATTLTVTVGSSNPNVDFQTLNGTLKLYATTTLGGTWTEVASYTLDGGTTEIDADVSGVANATDFFKAVVE